MPIGSIPCRSCGSPVARGSLVCLSCGLPADAPDPHPELEEPGTPVRMVAPEMTDGHSSGGIVVNPSVPGAYLRPSMVYQAPVSQAPQPTAMPLAGTSAPRAESPPGHEPEAPRPEQAPLPADHPFDAPTSFAGWLVAIGSGVGALSYLLPWAPNIVNYTSSWGLGSLSNLPVLALLIATAVLAILPNDVPLWIRSGVLGMVGGGLFLGLLWPYVVGDFGAEFGSIVGTAASIVLISGGIAAIMPRRRSPASA